VSVSSVITLAGVWILALSPVVSLAQPRAEREPMLLGVWDAPPFLIKQADGSWEGISVELWQAVASELSLTYEWREYASLEQLLRGVRAGEVDAVPGIAGLARHEAEMDLSHSYFRSGSGIAVAKGRSGPRLLRAAEKLLSWSLLRVVGLLLLLWLAAGAVVWLFERSRNREMFGPGTLTGIGNGIWWAAVTMTTVGYGDKAPRTLGGRTVAIFWMLASVILLSGFTASITASLTLDELSGEVRGLGDLHRMRAGAVADSRALRFLGERGIAARVFETEREGLSALAAGELDTFVHNDLILRYLARTEFGGQLRVLPSTFDHYQVKVALPSGSPLREALNVALLKVVAEGAWRQRVPRYIGSDD